MFISVVIPTYNRLPILQTCLRALEAQRLEAPVTGFEVVLVDDGSTDGTPGVARRLGAEVLEMPVNGGKTAALAAGIVMGVMIIPLVSSMSDDSIAAVPNAMRDGSLAMGATKSETIKQVLLPAALPGVVGGVLLAVSRAIGETMIVVMAAGYTANLTANPFDTITTVTVQIVTLLTGDQDFGSPHTLAAFALGLALFVTTFFLNYVALRVVKRYREAYE